VAVDVQAAEVEDEIKKEIEP
jgi:hypothetical protein